jgi:hypothetical protein
MYVRHDISRPVWIIVPRTASGRKNFGLDLLGRRGPSFWCEANRGMPYPRADYSCLIVHRFVGLRLTVTWSLMCDRAPKGRQLLPRHCKGCRGLLFLLRNIFD